MRTISLFLSCFLLLSSSLPLRADLTGASPTSFTFPLVSSGSIASGVPLGPVSGPQGAGQTLTLTGTGPFTLTTANCFGTVRTDLANTQLDPGNPQNGTLPAVIRLIYVPTNVTSTCAVTATGGAASQVINFSSSVLPRAKRMVTVKYDGTLLSALPYCSKSSTNARMYDTCTVQEATSRPGGTFLAPASMGQSYVDQTFGAQVTLQDNFPADASTTQYRRDYSVPSQISYNGDYVVLLRPSANAVDLHRINALDTSRDFLAVSSSSSGVICDNKTTSFVWLETIPSLATTGYCVDGRLTGNTVIKEFSFSTPPTATLTRTAHTHAFPMTNSVTGGSGAPANGYFAHFDDVGNVCVSNLRSATNNDTCSVRPSQTVSAVDTSTEAITVVGKNNFEINSFPVHIKSTGTLPAPLAALTPYCVIYSTGQDIKLSTYSGSCPGTAIDLTTTGTGTIAVEYVVRNVTMIPGLSKVTGKRYVRTGHDNPNMSVVWELDANAPTPTLTISGRDLRQIDNPTSSSTRAYWGVVSPATAGVDLAAGGHFSGGYSQGEPQVCGTAWGRINMPDFTPGTNCIKAFGANLASSAIPEESGGPVQSGLSPYDSYFNGSYSNTDLMTHLTEFSSPNGQGLTAAWRISSLVCAAGTCTATVVGSLAASGFVATTPIYIDGVVGCSGFPSSTGLRTTVATVTTTQITFSSSLTCTSTSNTGSVTQDISRNSGMTMAGVSSCRWGLGWCKTHFNLLEVSYGAGTTQNGSGTWDGNTIGAQGYNSLGFPTTSPRGETICADTNFGRTETIRVVCVDTGLRMDENTTDDKFDRYGNGVYIPPSQVAATTAVVNVTSPHHSYTCIVDWSTRPDFATFSSITLTGTDKIKTGTMTSLTSATQYYVYARCGPDAARSWLNVAWTTLRTN